MTKETRQAIHQVLVEFATLNRTYMVRHLMLRLPAKER